MGRFYRTATPQFEDFIYRPPWELGQQLLETNQKGYDEMVAQAQLFENLPINYIPSEDETENVKNIQEYYTARANDVVDRISKDPMEWRRYQKDLRDLGKELQQDYSTGNISRVQGSYSAYQKWMEDMKESRKNDPHRYNRMLQEGFTKWGGNSITGDTWNQEDIIPTPDFNKLIKDLSEQIKASSMESEIDNVSGLRIYTTKNGVKVLDPNKLRQAAVHRFMMDPQNKAWAAQSHRIGLGNFETTLDDPNHGIHNFIEGVADLNYSETKTGRKIGADQAGIAQMNEAGRNRRHMQAEAGKRERLLVQEKGKNNRLEMQYDLMDRNNQNELISQLKIDAAKGDAEAQQALDQIFATTIVELVKNPKETYDNNLSKAKGGDKKAVAREEKAIDFANKNTNVPKDFAEFYNKGLMSGKSKEQIIKEWTDKKNPSPMKKIKPEDFGLFMSNKPEDRWKLTQKYPELGMGYGGDPYMGHVPSAAWSHTEKSKKIESQLEDYIDDYEDSKKKYFNKHYSKQEVEKAFSPLSIEGQSGLKSLYNSNPSAWTLLDKEGNEINDAVVEHIRFATDGSGQGRIGFRAEDTEGNTVLMFPNRDAGSVYNVAEYLTVENLQNPNDHLKKSLSDFYVNDLTYTLNAGGQYATDSLGGQKNVLYEYMGEKYSIGSDAGGLYIQDPDSGDFVKDENGNKAVFQNAGKVIDFLSG